MLLLPLCFVGTLLPEVEEDGQRDEQRGDGQSVTHNGHVEEDVGRLHTGDTHTRIKSNFKPCLPL